MKTATELSQAIGKHGYLSIGPLRVRVTVGDARLVFGRLDFLVLPVEGSGTQWVAASRVALEGV